jgi:hypothetical protein
VLTMIAVVMAFVLSHSFIATQAPSTAIARNIVNLSHARAIAESGLQLVITEVKRNSDWRTDFSHGVWVSDEPYAGGTFTITGEDGVDTNGDDTISVPAEGDGDLTDDDTDALTLTSKGTYDGITHTVRGVVTGSAASGAPLPPLSLSGPLDMDGSTLIDSYDPCTLTTGSNAVVASNITSSFGINLNSSSQIDGDVYSGSGSDPNVVINAGASQITGTEAVLTEALAIPPSGPPSGCRPVREARTGRATRRSAPTSVTTT